MARCSLIIVPVAAVTMMLACVAFAVSELAPADSLAEQDLAPITLRETVIPLQHPGSLPNSDSTLPLKELPSHQLSGAIALADGVEAQTGGSAPMIAESGRNNLVRQDGQKPAAKAPSRVPEKPKRKVKVEPGKTTDINFDDLKFEMDKTKEDFKRSMIKDDIEQFFGTPVRIRGYMLPSYQQEGITNFVLVRDNQECCFGGNAALYDCIIVDMKEDAAASYTTRPITVEGVIDFEELLDPETDKHLAVYHLVAESAK